MPSCLFLSSLEGTNLVRTGDFSPSFPQTIFLLCTISNKLAWCRPCRQMRVTVRVCPDLSLGGLLGVPLCSLRFVISSILQHHVLSPLCSRHGHFMLLQAHGCRGSVSVACLSVRSMKALTAQQQALCQSTEELTRCSQIEEMRFCSLKHHLCFHGTGWWGGKGASYFVDSDCTDLS